MWLAAGVTDMRKGFDGLAALVQTALERESVLGHVFVFRGRRGDLVKLLWLDGDGLMPVRQAAGARALRVAAGDSGSVCADARRSCRCCSKASTGGMPQRTWQPELAA